ncbi:unnamed protein product [Rhizoctonia solani]|uniref:Cytochrome P450 n=1 Tax=Rhizoctonia solani TaxID=456999 RepID=A0A8H3CNV1_9AGAM|nr:unnamed protein product [Rhizoctonia solani]
MNSIANGLLLIIFLVSYWLAHKLVRAKVNSTLRLPGPGAAHWFWGHELIAYEAPYEEAYTQWMNLYGLTYKIKGALFHPDIIITADQVALDYMFGKGTYSYVKSPFIRPLVERLVGRGLVWAEGSVHKRQRQQLAPFFTIQAIRDTFSSINACVQVGTENLESHIIEKAGNHKEGLTLDMSEWTSSITLNIIGRFAFNYDFESGQGHAAQLIKHTWREQVKAGLHWTALLGQVAARAVPFVANLPIPFLEAQLAVKRKLREISQSIIEQDVNEGQEKDMLTTMVRLSSKGKITSTQDELHDHVCTMVIAGQETTAGSLGFGLHQLALNPEHQTRLREEIIQLGREPTYDDLMSGMPWLDAVTKERHVYFTLSLHDIFLDARTSFRHRPIVSHMERVAAEDCVLKLGVPVQTSDGSQITEIPLKSGQIIHIPTMAMNHMKFVWGDDADEFKPERWLDLARLERVDKNFGWNGTLVFSEGPRQCIGYRMAILSFKTVLAAHIRKFEFHDTGAVVHGRLVGTMQPYVAGEEDKGPQVPLRVSLVDELGSYSK